MRIFSLDDFVNNRIPGINHFREVLEEFEKGCVLPFLGKEVMGSFAYGSVNRGDCNVASDIDYFMIISDERHKERIKLAAQKAYGRFIDIQARVVHVDHARAGLHRIDDSFRQHLEFTVQKYGHRGKNPLDILSRGNVPLRRGLLNSMGIYLMKLNNGYCKAHTSESESLEFLRDIMEKLWHAMRVAVQHALGSVVRPGEDFEDTKEQLIRIFQTFRYSPDLMSDIDKIKNTAIEYTTLLKARQKGLVPKDRMFSLYNEMLKRIEGCYESAYHFIDKNSRIIAGI